MNGRHFRLAGNYYTDGSWYISKYTNLPTRPHQSRLGFTIRQTTGLGRPIGRTAGDVHPPDRGWLERDGFPGPPG